MLIIKLKPIVALFLLSVAFTGVFAQVNNFEDHGTRDDGETSM